MTMKWNQIICGAFCNSMRPPALRRRGVMPTCARGSGPCWRYLSKFQGVKCLQLHDETLFCWRPSPCLRLASTEVWP